MALLPSNLVLCKFVLVQVFVNSSISACFDQRHTQPAFLLVTKLWKLEPSCTRLIQRQPLLLALQQPQNQLLLPRAKNCPLLPQHLLLPQLLSLSLMVAHHRFTFWGRKAGPNNCHQHPQLLPNCQPSQMRPPPWTDPSSHPCMADQSFQKRKWRH
jgi:hypothetical protein